MPPSPPNPPKLHLNEHLSPRLAAQLRKHGFDVISSQEADLLLEKPGKPIRLQPWDERPVFFAHLCSNGLLPGETH